MVVFDPAANLPVKLRQRIERWQISPPKLQTSQYGPLDKYFNLRFPNALVKPQGLIRPKDRAAFVGYADAINLAAPDPGNVSLDSNGQAVDSDTKRYPDFIVASYYEENAQGAFPTDYVRLVVEVGSLYERAHPTIRQKADVGIQLHGYMAMLGVEGERWDDRVIGVAIIGTEVSFVRPQRVRATGLVRWTRSRWTSLYGQEWNTEMGRVAASI